MLSSAQPIRQHNQAPPGSSSENLWQAQRSSSHSKRRIVCRMDNLHHNSAFASASHSTGDAGVVGDHGDHSVYQGLPDIDPSIDSSGYQQTVPHNGPDPSSSSGAQSNTHSDPTHFGSAVAGITAPIQNPVLAPLPAAIQADLTNSNLTHPVNLNQPGVANPAPHSPRTRISQACDQCFMSKARVSEPYRSTYSANTNSVTLQCHVIVAARWRLRAPKTGPRREEDLPMRSTNRVAMSGLTTSQSSVSAETLTSVLSSNTTSIMSTH